MIRMKDVPEFAGRYSASEDGRIWSHRSASFLKPYWDDKNPYPKVSLRLDGKQVARTVHSLVASAYLGPRPEGLETRHMDGDPLNSRPSNLRYGTKGKNTLDSVGHGTHNNARKTHCKRGHEFTEENTDFRSGGSRRCRTCLRAAQQKARAR